MKKFAFKFDKSSSQTKLQQLIHAVTEAINLGILKEGDFLPSVNQMNKDSGISRDTIFKAYSILKQRSIISSFYKYFAPLVLKTTRYSFICTYRQIKVSQHKSLQQAFPGLVSLSNQGE